MAEVERRVRGVLSLQSGHPGALPHRQPRLEVLDRLAAGPAEIPDDLLLGTLAPLRSHVCSVRQPVSILSNAAGPIISPARYAARDSITHWFQTQRHRSHSSNRARWARPDRRSRWVYRAIAFSSTGPVCAMGRPYDRTSNR